MSAVSLQTRWAWRIPIPDPPPFEPQVPILDGELLELVTLGAIVESAKQGEELVEHVKERVKGSKPHLVCFKPAAPIRQIRFDMR